jgi:transcriptional regulator with XRE-family HTH domain
MRNASPVFDLPRIIARRHELGMPRQELGRRLGVTIGAIHRFERGLGHAEHSIGFALQLSEVLLMPVPNLFVRRTVGQEIAAEPAAASVAEDAESSDRLVIEAALMVAKNQISRQHLAASLGWSLKRVHHAIDVLRPELEGTARLIGVSNSKVSLKSRADVLTTDQKRRILDARAADRGLDRYEIQIVYDTYRGRLTGRSKPRVTSDKMRFRWGHLISKGVVEDRVRELVLTADTKFALQLTDEPAPVFSTTEAKERQAAKYATPKAPSRGQPTIETLSLLDQDSSRIWTIPEIREQLQIAADVNVKPGALRSTLRRLYENGQICRPRRGCYSGVAAAG